MKEKSAEGKTIFVSYAHEDNSLYKELDKHLSLLKKQHLIKTWHDQDISAGTEWEREISRYLNMADIILLLISPDFMASKYCFSVEMERAMERHERGEAQVIPIIVRPVDWQSAPFSKLQVLPTGARPIQSSKWHYMDEALFNVVAGIRKVIETSLRQEIQSHHPPFSQEIDQDSEIEVIHDLDTPSLPVIKTDIWRKFTNEEKGILAAYDQALTNEEYAGGRASLFQEKIAFLKQRECYEEALAVCNQALAEELYAHDKLTLIKQKADFLKQLGRYETKEILAAYDQALANEEYEGGRASLFQKKIAFLKQVKQYEKALLTCDQALAEELYAHDKLTLIKQKTDILKQLGRYDDDEILTTYDQALADEEYEGGKASLFQKKIAFLKQLGRYEEALAVCNQALAEELYVHDKLTLIKQKADFLKQLGRYETKEIVVAYDQALANEEYEGGRASLFQEKITFLKQLGHYEEALAVCNQALAEELYAHDKLTLIKQKADFLKRLGCEER